MTAANFDIAKQIAENAVIFKGIRRSDVIFQIRQKMVEKSLKNSDLAERLGVSEANVSRWLRGDQNIKIDTLYLLADAIQQPLSINVGGASEMEFRSSWEESHSSVSSNVLVLSGYSKKQTRQRAHPEGLDNGARYECTAAVA